MSAVLDAGKLDYEAENPMHIDQIPGTEQDCIERLQTAEADNTEGFRELVYQNLHTGSYHRLRELAEYSIDEDQVQYLYPGTGYEVSTSHTPDFSTDEDLVSASTLSEAYREWAKRCTGN